MNISRCSRLYGEIKLRRELKRCFENYFRDNPPGNKYSINSINHSKNFNNHNIGDNNTNKQCPELYYGPICDLKQKRLSNFNKIRYSPSKAEQQRMVSKNPSVQSALQNAQLNRLTSTQSLKQQKGRFGNPPTTEAFPKMTCKDLKAVEGDIGGKGPHDLAPLPAVNKAGKDNPSKMLWRKAASLVIKNQHKQKEVPPLNSNNIPAAGLPSKVESNYQSYIGAGPSAAPLVGNIQRENLPSLRTYPEAQYEEVAYSVKDMSGNWISGTVDLEKSKGPPSMVPKLPPMASNVSLKSKQASYCGPSTFKSNSSVWGKPSPQISPALSIENTSKGSYTSVFKYMTMIDEATKPQRGKPQKLNFDLAPDRKFTQKKGTDAGKQLSEGHKQSYIDRKPGNQAGKQASVPRKLSDTVADCLRWDTGDEDKCAFDGSKPKSGATGQGSIESLTSIDFKEMEKSHARPKEMVRPVSDKAKKEQVGKTASQVTSGSSDEVIEMFEQASSEKNVLSNTSSEGPLSPKLSRKVAESKASFMGVTGGQPSKSSDELDFFSCYAPFVRSERAGNKKKRGKKLKQGNFLGDNGEDKGFTEGKTEEEIDTQLETIMPIASDEEEGFKKALGIIQSKVKAREEPFSAHQISTEELDVVSSSGALVHLQG